MKQDKSSVPSSSNENATNPPLASALPVGALPATVTIVIGVLGEVLIGFALARHALGVPAWPDTISLKTIGRIPMVALGIAWLVSILAHAVGLFLQQEDFEKQVSAVRREESAPRSPSLYPGYVLALIAFAFSALAGIACVLPAGGLLLASLAYYRDLWKKPFAGPIVLSGLKALAVLLGATAGGWRGQPAPLPDLILACGILAAYTAASEVTSHHLPRRGLTRWCMTPVSAVVGIVPVIAAFCSRGIASLNSWMTVWLAIWLTARSTSLNLAQGKIAGPTMEQTLMRQFQRGELLLLACLFTARLPEWQGTIAFAAVLVLLPLAAVLDRR